MRYLIIISCLISLNAFSQGTSDLELWAGTKIHVSPAKKLRITTQFQNRWNNNVSAQKNYLAQFDLRYKLSKHFYVKPSFRLSRAPDINKDKNRYSMNIGYTFDKKKFPLTIENRLRYQYENFVSTVRTKHLLRNKLELGYKLSRLVDPYFSYEIFYGFEQFDDHRFRLGLDWRVNRTFKVNTFYALERELNKKNPDMTHIIGLSLNAKIDVRRKD